MAVAFNFSATEEGSIHDTGMVILIEDDDVISPRQRADRPQIDLHARRKDQRVFLSYPIRQLGFQLFMHRHVAVQETGPGAARAKTLNGVNGSLPYFGMGGQPQVIVRSAHDHSPPLVSDLCALIFIQWDKIRVNSSFFSVLNNRKLITFFENIHSFILYAQQTAQ